MGVKQQNVGAIIRDVADNGAEYTVNRHGVPAAVILPYCKAIALRAVLNTFDTEG